ncbi:MAG TPA: ankyrin repeat domain-containing protein [Pyrinomonadaceae bacterium]|jgi:ankyrin repeat protein
MKTLGSLALYKFSCFCVLLFLWIPTHAQTVLMASASSGVAAQGACPSTEREKDLFEAIKQKDSVRVKALLAAGVSPNARAEINYDSYRNNNMFCAPALMHAAHLGDVKTVQVLLAAKADVNARDSVDKFIWGYLMGFNTIRRMPPGQMLLDEMNARLQIARALLAAGANPDGVDKYNWNETAVFHAIDAGVMTGDLRILKLLLAAGAAVNMQNNSTISYAIIASQRVETDSEPRIGGQAAEASEIEVIKALLAAGANVNAIRNGFTALRIEASGSRQPGSVKRMKALLAAGANVNEQYGDIKETPLLIALIPHEIPSFDTLGVPMTPAQENRNQLEVIKLLLAAGADPNKKDGTGDAPLHRSFYAYQRYQMTTQPSDFEGIFKALIAAGANINERDAKGRTVLMLASSKSSEGEYINKVDEARVRLIKILIEAGADVNATDVEKQTPLMFAIKTKASDGVIRTLIAAGAVVNATDATGQTTLMAAIIYHSDEVVQMLLAAGVNVNARDKEGATALLLTSAGGSRPSVTRLLIAARADVNIPNQKGQTPLMAAITSQIRSDSPYYQLNQSEEMIRFLIEAKANVNARGPNGDTALMLAIMAGRVEGVIQALLAAGANVNIANDSGDTLLMVVAKRYSSERQRGYSYPSESVFKALLAAGAKVTTLNQAGESAMSIMATKPVSDSLPIIRAMIAAGRRNGARGYPRVADLLAAISRAAGHSPGDVVQELIAAGTNVNGVDEEGRPALIVAVSEAGNAGVVRALLAAGARVNARDRNGDTALIAAVREYLPGGDEYVQNALRRDPAVIRALLDAKADTGAKDKDGRTALSLAKMSGNQNIIGLLEGAGARQ